jgi:hypothetical protein
MARGLAKRADLHYGLRLLLRKPGFTLVVALTLALGIGANTAIFSVVNAVVLRPLAFPEADRLVALWETVPGGAGRNRSRATFANFLDWREQSQSFAGLAAFGATSFNLTGTGEPEQLLGVSVMRDYFTVLGLEPILGRVLGAVFKSR